MSFLLSHKDSSSSARAGKFRTARGLIPTPVFMPVGTLGNVKGFHPEGLSEKIGAQIMLSNTYHLMLRPGIDLVVEAGGLHSFCGWNRSILTDSGGYQIFSLAKNCKVDRGGVEFRSHVDGSRHRLTPESCMEIQSQLGSDIHMALDECPPYPISAKRARESMDITHEWLTRCYEAHKVCKERSGGESVLFPVIQGGCYTDLRKACAEFAATIGFEGYALGGLSVGEPREKLLEMVGIVCQVLPEGSPRYLMGVGMPVELLRCIELGIDMFDCVVPTRHARHGHVFTSQGVLNIRNRKWRTDHSPLDHEAGDSFTNHFSKSYLRHLFICRDPLGALVATHQNLLFYHWLMRNASSHIKEGTYSDWKREMEEIIVRKLG